MGGYFSRKIFHLLEILKIDKIIKIMIYVELRSLHPLPLNRDKYAPMTESPPAHRCVKFLVLVVEFYFNLIPATTTTEHHNNIVQVQVLILVTNMLDPNI